MSAENNRETISSSSSMVEHAQRLGVLPADARERARAGTVWARARAAFVADARLLLIALWLGAAVFFSFAVAPSAFAVIPARELAGAVVSRTLAVVNTGGAVIGLLLLLSLPLDGGARSRRASAGEAASLLVLTALCAAGQWVVAARMHSLRAQVGRPIDELAAGDPLRVAFNSLHVYSVWALVAAMLAGGAALLLIARRARMEKQG
jgi:hypothetical protein